MNNLKHVRNFHNDRLNWAVVGPAGGIHVWCIADFSYGGVEQHSSPPTYDPDKKPDSEDCWLLNAPCWHDGSSVYWRDSWRQTVGFAVWDGNDEAIWRRLEYEYQRRFTKQEPDHVD